MSPMRRGVFCSTFKLPTDGINWHRSHLHAAKIWSLCCQKIFEFIYLPTPLFLSGYFFFLLCKQSASNRTAGFRCGCTENKKRKKLSKSLKPKQTLNILFLFQLFDFFFLLSFPSSTPSDLILWLWDFLQSEPPKITTKKRICRVWVMFCRSRISAR